MSFPSLRELIDRDCPELFFHDMLRHAEADNPQAYHAALFVDTLQSVGQHCEKVDPGFFIDKAFEVWDEKHKEAFAYWIGQQFFPAAEFCRLSVDLPFVIYEPDVC